MHVREPPERLLMTVYVDPGSSSGLRNTEVIVATSPSGRDRALLGKLLEPSGVRVTRIASGVAVGGELEHAEQVTPGRASDERRELR